jgi:peptide/nickel transport system substrate-binding protein
MATFRPSRTTRRHRTRRSGRAALIAAAAAAALLLGACTNLEAPDSEEENASPVSGGTLNMLGAGDVDYMDPNISNYSAGNLVLRLWSRQLISYRAGEIDPDADLATEVPTLENGGVTEDGLTYTLRLRDGVAWDTSPQRPIVAADVVRGVKRSCNPAAPFGSTPLFDYLLAGYQDFCDGFANVDKTPAAFGDYIENTPLSGVEAADEKTVVFNLTAPASHFVNLLTLSAFAPAPVEINDYLPGSAELAQNTTASGPYKVESYEPTKSIVLVRNPAWDAETDTIRKGYVDRIVVDQTVNPDTIVQQLQAGTDNADMQFDVTVPPSQLPPLLTSDDPNLNLGETPSQFKLIFNTKSPNADNALGDRAVRQALSSAIDRAGLIQVLGGSEANAPLTHNLPSTTTGSEDLDLWPYERDAATSGLEEAGHGEGLKLRFLYMNDVETQVKAFQVIQQNLSDAGVEVEGVPASTIDVGTKYLFNPESARRGDWDLALAPRTANWTGDNAIVFFKPLLQGEASFPPAGSNFGLYDNDEVNALIDRAAAEPDADAARDLWNQADELVMQDAAIYPIAEPRRANYHAAHVHGATFLATISNFDPTIVWLDEDRQGG